MNKISGYYARVSTERQEKEATIKSQISEIEERVKKDGNIIGENFKFRDEGWSGELLARPGLDNLRDVLKTKTIELLYVYDLGRLSRTFLNQLILINEIKEAGVQLISLHDINPENDEQVFAQRIMGVFHDYERIKIAERMRRGKLYKARNGMLFGWQAPFGYRYVKSLNKNQGGKFEIDSDEGKVVEIIFKLVGNEGFTIRQVIKRLYELGISPRKSRKKTWSTSTLSRLLRDETYIGTTYYNKRYAVIPENPIKTEKYKKIKKSSRKVRSKDEWFPVQVPAIIDKDLFERTQKQMIVNNQFAMRNKKNDYLLSGLVYCSCNNKRSGEGNSKNGHRYYRCTDRILRYPLPKECRAKGVNASVFDSVVWTSVANLLTNPQLIKKQTDRWNSHQQNHFVEKYDISILEKSLASLEEEENRYLKAYGAEIISLEQYADQIKDLKLKKEAIRNKISAQETGLKNGITTINLTDSTLNRFCDRIKASLFGLTFQERQFIVRKILKNVTTDGITATINGYIPLEIPKESEVQAQNVKFETINRDRRSAKRRKVHLVQCSAQKAGG